MTPAAGTAHAAAPSAHTDPAVLRPLLGHPLLVVTGKGGAGKSTVAAAVALAVAAEGRRALVVEVAGRQDVRRMLADPADPAREDGPIDVVHPVAPGVDHLSIDAQHALADYLRRHLPRPAAALLLTGHAFELLAAATPGLAELLCIGEVWQLTQPDRPGAAPGHDVVILDAPATGHALALLRAAGTFAAAAARTGPVGTRSRDIDADLRDPARTAVVAVTLAEELAVAETLQLRDELQDSPGIALDRVVVNAVLPDRYSADEAQRLAAAPASPWSRTATRAAVRVRHQQRELRRLRAGLPGVPVVSLPLLGAARPGREELRRLAAPVVR